MSRVELDSPRPLDALVSTDLSERIFSQPQVQSGPESRFQPSQSSSAAPYLPGLELSGTHELPGVSNTVNGEAPAPRMTDGIMLAQAPTQSRGRDAFGLASSVNDAASTINTATGGRYGNNIFFSPSSGPIGVLTGVDVTPVDIAGYVANAWDRVSGLNQALSGQRPAEYSAITFNNGQPVIVGRPQDRTQTINFRIDGRNTPVPIDLPGFRGSAVSFATDGRHIIAIDPRNNDVWMLQHNVPRVQIPIINPDSYTWTRINRR